ncbi:MAG: Crp/Fnr family transcriptional regulator [Clostridia bacterium]|nr:Crp/Fnr family transcriptional regulator [Clostridia bacterium]
MYEALFDQNLQREMDTFFLNTFRDEGKVKWYEKGVVIDSPDRDQIFLIMEGELNQQMFSKKGSTITFFRLFKGNIFGEIDFFDSERTFVTNKTVTSCKIASIKREVVERKLKEDARLYEFFLTSIVKKYRIIMLELANHKFNDSVGKLADFFVRLYYTETELERERIKVLFTQEEVANRVGLNRVTVTRALKYFKENDLIEIQNRMVIIKDIEGLKELTDIPT